MAAVCNGAVLGGGVLVVAAAPTAGGISRPQIVCSAKPGPGTPIKPGSISISSSLTRSFSVAGENAQKVSATKLEVAPVAEEETAIVEEPEADKTPEEISAFMTDVANLVKLVNSRDIVELELKHKDYEVVIRKEAQQPPPPPMTFPGPHVMAHTSFPGYPQPPPPPPTPAAVPVAAEPVAAPPPTPVKPSHPPMLSPMAGTFYRSPGPGESAFVQVGDKVTKGQVVCIVEAMKLMNEIEADQSGYIVEILAEDGKPVSIESPLYSIKP
ncbi:unnamed protein product [Calypogeia fissa]